MNNIPKGAVNQQTFKTLSEKDLAEIYAGFYREHASIDMAKAAEWCGDKADFERLGRIFGAGDDMTHKKLRTMSQIMRDPYQWLHDRTSSHEMYASFTIDMIKDRAPDQECYQAFLNAADQSGLKFTRIPKHKDLPGAKPPEPASTRNVSDMPDIPSDELGFESEFDGIMEY